MTKEDTRSHGQLPHSDQPLSQELAPPEGRQSRHHRSVGPAELEGEGRDGRWKTQRRTQHGNGQLERTTVLGRRC